MLDIDECHKFQIDCGEDRACFNTLGAYECIDIPCPVGYIRQYDNDCLLKCYRRSSSCRPHRAIHIRYRFIAVPRFTSTDRTLFSLPITHRNKPSMKIIGRNNIKASFPFRLDGIHLKTKRTLTEPHEYEFEIYSYNNELNIKHRSRLHRHVHTIFVIRVNISPFRF